MKPAGVVDLIRSITLGVSRSWARVRMAPGATALTVTPCGASSRASARVKPMTPILAAALPDTVEEDIDRTEGGDEARVIILERRCVRAIASDRQETILGIAAEA